VFTPASLAASGFVGNGPYTLSSTTITAAQTAIHQLEFDPTDNRVNAGSTETTFFMIGVNDATVTTNDSTTSVVATSINDAGIASITGTATEGSILTAGITDNDGISGSTFTYQWKRGGVNISGATASTYTLVQADVGSTITVVVGYTDDLGTAENVTSSATLSVSNINNTGVVSISGAATQGSTLTTSIADNDGATGTIIYQWKRGGVNVAGASANSYTLVQADVGSSITVAVSYTDDQGTLENITSAATVAVSNINDTGVVTISGVASQGSTLSAGVTDIDGTTGSTFSYQWKRGGANIAGATASTYTLVQADVGSSITVTVDYIDDQSTAESITSAATAIVININDVGVATIVGGATQGVTLTAGVSDADGITGSISYQWKRDGAIISDAIASTYTLVQADVPARRLAASLM